MSLKGTHLHTTETNLSAPLPTFYRDCPGLASLTRKEIRDLLSNEAWLQTQPLPKEALPADIPCTDKVEEFVVPDHDLREKLRGQRGLRCKADTCISQGSIIGEQGGSPV